MKRRSFIKGTTTAITGLGISNFSSAQSQALKGQQSFESYVTLDQEKVSIYNIGEIYRLKGQQFYKAKVGINWRL